MNKTEKDIYDKNIEENENNNYKEITKKLSQKTSSYFYVFLSIFLLAIVLSLIFIFTKCWRKINDCNILKKNPKKASIKQEDYFKNKEDSKNNRDRGLLPDKS